MCDTADTSTAEACINFCVPIFEGDVLEDVQCALDDCDEGAYAMEDVFRCPSPTAAGQSYTCVSSDRSPDPSRIGFCQAAPGLLEECIPGEGGCESGTFCVDLDACANTPDRWRFGVSSSAPGYCTLPRREGEQCDSNLGRGEPGCAPCEAGTWCRVTADYGRICVRACELPSDPGTPRPELCACSSGVDSCVTIPSPDGEPDLYCPERVVPNGHRCNPQLGPPCADVGSDCQPSADPVTGNAPVCCRYDGDECSSANDCCTGRSICVGGVCTACGREGEAPTAAGCCPGHVLADDASGDGLCHSCAVSPEGRARALFEGANCGGEFVQFESEDDERETIVVPLDGNTGAGPAELPLTSGRAERVRYSVRDEHRVFLLQGNLTGEWDNRDPPSDPPDFLPHATAGWPPAGVTVGHFFAHLPGRPPGGGVREIDLSTLPGGQDASSWQSVRVYDAGSCSRFVPYVIATDGLVAALNRYLADFEFEFGGVSYGSDPLTLAPTYDGSVLPHITPILSSGTGDFGRAIDSDQLNAFIEYEATGGAALGCENGRLRLSTGIRLTRRPAFVPTLDGELEDRRMVEPHSCPESPTCWERCWITGDRYLCRQLAGSPPIRRDLYERPRQVRIFRDAYDYTPQIEFLDGGVVDCSASGLNDLITGIIQGQIRSQFSRVLDRLSGSLTRDLREWGFAFSDLPSCERTDPVTGDTFPSDAMCGRALPTFFGGRRHGCVGIDASGELTDDPSLAEDYRCARVRFEIRRINVRPDGLEVVLADSSSDPQHGMLTTSPFSALRELCDSDREGASPAGAGVALIQRAWSIIANDPNRRLCHADDGLTLSAGRLVGCRGICPDDDALFGGTQCGGPSRRIGSAARRCYVQPLAAIVPEGPDRGSAQCCLPAEFCPVPPEGGGRPFYESPGDAPIGSSSTWSCTNPDNDRWACGGCGNVCAEEERCCAGGCVDTDSDPDHCGGCGDACGEGRPCVGGACCGEGEFACPTATGGRACTDVSRNPFACGDCETVCSTGHCTDGVCCLPGQAACGPTSSDCADLDSDPLNCGACGVACESGESCCDGGCVDTSLDVNHCGGCGIACPGGFRCSSGRCVCVIGCP